MSVETVILETSEIVTNAVDVVVVDVLLEDELPPADEPPVEPDDEPVELEPDPVAAPTWPVTPTTRPAMGDVSVAAARLVFAVDTSTSAALTFALAELTADSRLETDWPPPEDDWLPVVGVAAAASPAARSELAAVRAASAAARSLAAVVRACLRVVVSSVPNCWPAVTVCPNETSTLAMVPETAKLASTVDAAATAPLAVMVLDTTPFCTVVVSWLADDEVAAGGKTTK
jgi:hypothetical protein